MNKDIQDNFLADASAGARTRTLLAAHALTGILSNVDMIQAAIQAADTLNVSIQEIVTRNAVCYADELIKQLRDETKRR